MDLSTHLHGILSKVEDNVYIGDLPSVIDNCSGVSVRQSNENIDYFGTSISTFRPIATVYTRDKSYESGSFRVELIKELLHKYHDDKIESSTIIGEPLYLGRNVKGLHEFQISFNILTGE